MVMKAIDEDASDDDIEVDQDELAGFAEHLGLSLPAEQDLMWICKMALNAPVPAGLHDPFFQKLLSEHVHRNVCSV